MCVVALAWQVHANWPLILIGNRDEYHARPAAPLAAWDDGNARLLTNRPQSQILTLGAGVHALANEPVDSPCLRAERLQAALSAVVDARTDPEGLLDTLTAEGDPALFLRGDVYGTRASTLVAVAADGTANMIERRYEAGGHPIGTTALQFRLG